MPQSTLSEIQLQFHTDRERKTEVLRVCSTKHPQLTWEQVSDVLYRVDYGKHHSVLERVQSLVATGENLSVASHSGCQEMIMRFLMQSIILLSA